MNIDLDKAVQKFKDDAPQLKPEATLFFVGYEIAGLDTILKFKCPDPGPDLEADYTLVVPTAELESTVDFAAYATAKLIATFRISDPKTTWWDAVRNAFRPKPTPLTDKLDAALKTQVII